jgi:hypothetical protein
MITAQSFGLSNSMQLVIASSSFNFMGRMVFTRSTPENDDVITIDIINIPTLLGK